MRKQADKVLLLLTILLIGAGLFIFLSASLGIITRGNDFLIRLVATQLGLGVILGGIALLLTARIPYKKLRAFAPHVYIASLLATLLVFIPGVGLSLGGATRWITIGSFSFQPAEFLKLGTVLFLAFALSYGHAKKKKASWLLGAFFLIVTIAVLPLIFQPDTGTILVLGAATFAMLFVSGISWRVIGVALLIPVLLLAGLVMTRPYVEARLLTFLNPAVDPLGAGYQIQQSHIAIGSGGLTGRGFGQSVQKFNYLPEPISDSIFAVYAEEFGFVGASLLIALFLFFGLRGLGVARKAKDRFGGLLATGIVILLLAQAFTNIGAMLGVIPLTGLPLTFVSHGGTALLFALVAVGILLSISKYQTTR